MLLNSWTALVLSASLACTCSAQTFVCPEQINTSDSLLNNHPGWQPFRSSQQQYFEQISITSGPPDQEATLVPDVITNKQLGWTSSAGEELWMVCHYLSSNIRLAQPLPVGIRHCVVKLKPVGTKAVQQTNALTCT